MAILPLLSLAEQQVFDTLRDFLLTVVRSTEFLGSINESVLTVQNVLFGTLAVGQSLQDPAGLLAPGTQIVGLMAGAGATGSYVVTPVQTVPLAMMGGVVEVVRGQINRVPEPLANDFVVTTSIHQQRLEINETSFVDGVITASVAGNTLTISEITRGAPLMPGCQLLDVTGALATNTVLGPQISGTVGGVGTYFVTPAQTVASETIYAGLRQDFVATQMTVQTDVHGPNAGDNIKLIDGLFRSEVSTEAFVASGYEVRPLYASEAREAPYLNAEQQIEYRWSIDLELQFNPVISTPQQFADELEATYYEADGTGKSSTGVVTAESL